MLPHALTFLGERAHLPWLIVGKGPSFDEDKARDFDGYVMGINEVMNVMRCDACILNDYPVLSKLCAELLRPPFAYIVPSHSHDWAAKEGTSIDAMLRIAKTLSLIGDRLFTFDLNTSMHRSFDEAKWPLIHAHNSTYESALWLLGYAGVKEVFTLGIDGTQAYHPTFGVRTDPVPFTAVKYYAQIPIDFFNITVTRL